WVSYCPCCNLGESFILWQHAHAWAELHAARIHADTNPSTGDEPIDLVPAETAGSGEQLGCERCVGGYVPAGSRPWLGYVYLACASCADVCRCCNGTGLFPADTTCTECLTEAFTTLGHTVTFCHSCAGVTHIRPTHEVTT